MPKKIDKSKVAERNALSDFLDSAAIASILIIAVLAIAAAIGMYTNYFNGSVTTNHSRWGQFGDFFGGTLNPIFGFLTIIALLITIRVQIKELRQTREATEKSALALGKQYEIALKQSYEQSFFRFLDELKNDEFIKDCKKKSVTLCIKVHKLVYKDGIENADRKITSEEIKNTITTLVAAGETTQVLVAKTIILLKTIENLGAENRLYIKTLQTHLEPPLISFIYHFSSMHAPKSYEILKRSGLIKGISKKLIFTKEIASCISDDFVKEFENSRTRLIDEFLESTK